MMAKKAAVLASRMMMWILIIDIIGEICIAFKTRIIYSIDMVIGV